MKVRVRRFTPENRPFVTGFVVALQAADGWFAWLEYVDRIFLGNARERYGSTAVRRFWANLEREVLATLTGDGREMYRIKGAGDVIEPRYRLRSYEEMCALLGVTEEEHTQ